MLRGCEKEEERTELRALIMTSPEERVVEDDDLPDWMRQHAPSWWHGDKAAHDEALGVKSMLGKLKQG